MRTSLDSGTHGHGSASELDGGHRLEQHEEADIHMSSFRSIGMMAVGWDGARQIEYLFLQLRPAAA